MISGSKSPAGTAASASLLPRVRVPAPSQSSGSVIPPASTPPLLATPIDLTFGENRRLRIAIVSPEVGRGAGVPHYWLALAQALSAQHEVHVYTAKADHLDVEDVQVHMLPGISWGWFISHISFYLAGRGLFALRKLQGRRPFDLVLGIGALTPFADVATVHFVQARELEIQSRGLFPREEPLAGLNGLDYALYSRIIGWLGRRFYRTSSTAIVAISEGVKQDLARFEGAQLSATTVVPDGVDVQRFNPLNREVFRTSTRTELGLLEGQVAVLFVGNSWGRKGLCTAIEAISGPGQADTRLIVVGRGVRSVFTADLPPHVARRIIFAGSHTSDVERFYAAADVFLMPTLYEPFGLVILEALASGLPTIVSASAGASEWLTDGENVVLLQDPSDGGEAQRALLSITSNSAFASSLALNGRRAAESLQWSEVARLLVEASMQSKNAVAIGA